MYLRISNYSGKGFKLQQEMFRLVINASVVKEVIDGIFLRIKVDNTLS